MPAIVEFSGCSQDQGGKSEWTQIVCTSRFTYNVTSYDNAQCTGTPISSAPDPSTYRCRDAPDVGSADSTCVTGSFDPAEPEQLTSIDLYRVTRGSAGGATCPPTVGEGVELSSRQYFATFNITATLDACARRSTSGVSILSRCNDRSLVYEFFSNANCVAPASTTSSGCRNELSAVQVGLESARMMTPVLSGRYTQVLAAAAQAGVVDTVEFYNSGGLCLPPTPVAASISSAGLVSIGAGAGVAAAALAFAANYAYQRAWSKPRAAADAAPLLGAGESVAQAPRYTA